MGGIDCIDLDQDWKMCRTLVIAVTKLGKKGKGKAIPLQALTGPECSRRLRLPDFKTIGT
jgi:hypothetical protein